MKSSHLGTTVPPPNCYCCRTSEYIMTQVAIYSPPCLDIIRIGHLQSCIQQEMTKVGIYQTNNIKSSFQNWLSSLPVQKLTLGNWGAWLMINIIYKSPNITWALIPHSLIAPQKHQFRISQREPEARCIWGRVGNGQTLLIQKLQEDIAFQLRVDHILEPKEKRTTKHSGTSYLRTKIVMGKTRGGITTKNHHYTSKIRSIKNGLHSQMNNWANKLHNFLFCSRLWYNTIQGRRGKNPYDLNPSSPRFASVHTLPPP